jgi:hypothetical protein
LGLWSVLFGEVPFLNLAPAVLGLIFSLKSIRRNLLRGIAVAEQINLIGRGMSEAGLNAPKNDRVQGQIEQLERVAQLLEKGVITAEEAKALKKKFFFTLSNTRFRAHILPTIEENLTQSW